MSKQTINIGTSPNSGTGDPLRTAFTKVNENFTEVYTIAQSAYNYANTIVSDTQIDQYARNTSNTASNNITIIQGVNITQNTNITNATNLAQSAYNAANTGADTGDFTFSGNTMTVPLNGIIRTPDDKTFQLQAKDLDSLLRNEIKIDPNNGTYMSVWSGELNTSFNTSDWATASWVNDGGIGLATFTVAETLQDFWTTGVGSFVNSVEVSINGGARTPVQYDGNNGQQFGVALFTDAFPGTTTTITSLTFYYRTQSKIEIDYDGGEILLDGQALNINLQTTNGLNLQSGQTLDIKNIGQQPVRIFTDNTTHTWEFDSGGSLTLPREGRITGIGDGGGAGDRYGYISWAGNTSGDGAGYNTMRLVPDLLGLEDADQYIILDPTSPGHIHIRAGGTQDSSQAILYFGGENSHVKIDSGPNPPVTVMANNKSWTFSANGNLTFPNSSVQTGSAISITELKSLVAGANTYAEFQTAIANL